MMLDYIDSVILVYYYDHVGHFQTRASRWLSSFQGAGDTFAVSDLVRMECRVMPLRLGNLAKLATFDNFFADPDVHHIPLTPAIFDRAAKIRALYNFKTPDAIHLAAAVESGCDRFLTHDARLGRFTGINVEILP
jgi:predicted nucleic acid-binding protein